MKHNAVSFLRYYFNYIRTFYKLKIKYRNVKYKGFVRIMRDVRFSKSDIHLNNNVQLGAGSRLIASVHFGTNVLVAGNVFFIARHDHDFSVPGQTIWDGKRGKEEPIIIEDDVWIGYNSMIMGGVKIGRGSIVAAGSLVITNVPECEIWGGRPARKLKNRFHDEEMRRIHLIYLDSIKNEF